MSRLDAPFEENKLHVSLPAVLTFFLFFFFFAKVATPTEESGSLIVIVQQRIIKRNTKCSSTRCIWKSH